MPKSKRKTSWGFLKWINSPSNKLPTTSIGNDILNTLFSSCFFEILLENKEFTISGFGKIKLAFSFYDDEDGNPSLKVGIVIFDIGNHGTPQKYNFIYKIIDEDKLKKEYESSKKT